MATRDELAELRATVERRDAMARRLGRAASAAFIATGFLALLWFFTG